MQREVQIFATKHIVTLTAGELRLLISKAVREKYPNAPSVIRTVFSTNYLGDMEAKVLWEEPNPGNYKR